MEENDTTDLCQGIIVVFFPDMCLKPVRHYPTRDLLRRLSQSGS